MQVGVAFEAGAPVPTSDQAAADAQMVALRQHAPGRLFSCAEVSEVVACFKVRLLTDSALCPGGGGVPIHAPPPMLFASLTADSAVCWRDMPMDAHTLLTCPALSPHMQAPAHRVEAAVALWALAHDRDASFWSVLYGLCPLEQAAVATRLGPQTVFNAQHCSM